MKKLEYSNFLEEIAVFLDKVNAFQEKISKNYFETKIANELVSPDNKLNAIEYRELSKYINDVFIYN